MQSWQCEGECKDCAIAALPLPVNEARAYARRVIGPLTFLYVGTTIEGKMPFVRAKHRGQKSYYYLVENKREGTKVRQRIIRYLGTKPPTEEELKNILKEVHR